MTSAWPWDVLEIEPTREKRAIRSAYALVLKSGDYEQDADGFMALREARDFALLEAERPVEDWSPGSDRDIITESTVLLTGHAENIGLVLVPSTPVDDSPFRIIDPTGPVGAISDLKDAMTLPDHPSIVVPLISGPHPGGTVSRETMPQDLTLDGRCQALHENLFAEHDARPGEQRPPPLALLPSVLDHPDMAEISIHARVEGWLGEVLARTVPKSDPLILYAAPHFGWDVRAGEIGLPPAIAYVAGRYHALSFFEAVQDPKHKFFKEWRELCFPTTENSRRGGGVKRKNILTLLALVRRDYPDLESCFDAWRVTLWEETVSRGSSDGQNWLTIVVLCFLALVRLASFSSDTTPPINIPINPAFEFTDREKDVAAALDNVSDIRVEADSLKRSNPAFYEALGTAWQDARDAKRSRWEYFADVSYMLHRQYDYGAARFPYDLIAARRRFERDVATELKKRNPVECDNFLRTGRPPEHFMTPELNERQKALSARAVLETGAPIIERTGDGTFMVPGETVARAMGLAHMPRDQFESALDQHGSPRERCIARIALIEAALEAPRSIGLKLLRAM